MTAVSARKDLLYGTELYRSTTKACRVGLFGKKEGRKHRMG